MHSAKRLGPFLLSLFICGSVSAATYVVPPDDVLIGKADAIVIARALHSRVEESKDRGIETVTVFAVEERLKGDRSIESGFSLWVPGGVIEEDGKPVRAKVVYGAPQFVVGEQVLLFTSRGKGNHHYVTDFGLGFFGFATDDLGNRVLIRAATEIHGWDLDGKPYREPRRHAERFLQFIRDHANFRPRIQNYTVEPRDLVSQSGSIQRTGRLRQITMDCVGCTVTQYTLANAEGDQGFRWKTFPVSWNRGSACSQAANSGNDAIDAAFNSWKTGSSTNYQRTTAVADTDGIFEAPDGVNNIVFEKDMSGNGVAAFSCAVGGVLGLAGVQNGIGDPTNMVNGETFFATTEGDVSMNQGLCGCLPAAADSFNSGLTHEVGHTFGFRHADKSRDNSQACTNFPAYDCANSAIMTAFVSGGLNGALAAWDQRAVAALYPPSALAAPTGVVATATGTTQVTITWNAAIGAASYRVYRRAPGGSFTLVGSPATTNYVDDTAVANTAYLYKVRSFSGGESTDSNIDLATTVIFTDPTLTAGATSVKAVHFTELRTAVDAVRTLAGLGAGSYTDAVLNSSVTVQRLHVIDLRTAIDAARADGDVAQSAMVYTDPTITAGSTTVKKAHIDDLRNAVK
jgi:hypothetical protein